MSAILVSQCCSKRHTLQPKYGAAYWVRKWGSRIEIGGAIKPSDKVSEHACKKDTRRYEANGRDLLPHSVLVTALFAQTTAYVSDTTGRRLDSLHKKHIDVSNHSSVPYSPYGFLPPKFFSFSVLKRTAGIFAIGNHLSLVSRTATMQTKSWGIITGSAT